MKIRIDKSFEKDTNKIKDKSILIIMILVMVVYGYT